MFSLFGRLWSVRQTHWFWVSAGIVGPIVCLVMEPLVFQGGDEHGPMLGRFWVFCYSFMSLEMLTLASWLLVRERFGALTAIVAGMLFMGTAFASGFGLLILPFTLLGLLLLISVLGFMPWLTAYAYLYQGNMALKSARSRLS